MEKIQSSVLGTAAKRVLSDTTDCAYYLETLRKHPESAWFAPANYQSDKFDICQQLADFGLICVRRVPQWSFGVHNGTRIEFLYREGMDY